MTKGNPNTPPPIKRSPTGRIPKWVMDEAAGRAPVDAVPFRAAADTITPAGTGAKRRSRRSWRAVKVAAVILGFAGLTAAAWKLGLGPQANPQAGSSANADGQAAGRTSPPAGLEEAPAPLGTPPPAPTATTMGFRFSAVQGDSTAPVAWSPCRPIHFVIRPDNAPPDGDKMINESFARLTAATGLVFVNDGPTSEAPSESRDAYQPDTYGDRWAPVLIAWATPDEVPDFGVDIAGEAGPTRITTPSGDDAYISGIVYLDPTKINEIRKNFSEPVARSVIMHELGHLVGLAHVNDENQIMWPRGINKRLTEYQPGDIAGLAALGHGACQPDI